MKLLLIEDDESLVAQLSQKLKLNNFDVDCSLDGEDGLYRAQEYIYDLIIVDLGLPKISGLDVVKKLRAGEHMQPILILTARSSWQDKVYGLKAGADDYLVKPFQLEELVARVQALLRRAGGYASSKIKQGAIELDLETQIVCVNQQEVDLTAFEYKLLQYFMLHPNKVASKAVLMDYLYDEESECDSNVIEVMIGRLRQKIDPKNTEKPIETLRGRGYRLTVKATND